MLANPNNKSPAQKEAFESYNKKSDEYRRKVREQARECVPRLEDFKRHLNDNNKNEKDNKENKENKDNKDSNDNTNDNNNSEINNTNNN